MGTRKSSNKISDLFGSERFSDIVLVVGQKPNEKRFPGHRLILSLHSAVFEAMFYGSLATDEKEITLPEDDPDSFELIMKYFHTDELDLQSAKKAMDILSLADKYLAPNVKEHCISYLSKNISSDLVISIYEMAQLMNEQSLRLQCWKHITFFTGEVLKGSGFVDANVSTVTSILVQDFLNIDSEVQLYEAIVRWGRHQCIKKGLAAIDSNIRKEIEGLLCYIKFLVMTPECFTRVVGKDKILSSEERLSILQNIIVPGINALPANFNDDRVERSRLLPGNSVSITSKGIREYSQIHKDVPMCFKQIVWFPLRDVFIYGFRAFLSTKSDICHLPDTKCNVSVTNITRNYKMERKDLTLFCDKTDFVVETDDPIYVPCGDVCTIELRLSHIPDCVYYCSGNCRLPHFVVDTDRSITGKRVFHLHDILVWHIFQRPTGDKY